MKRARKMYWEEGEEKGTQGESRARDEHRLKGEGHSRVGGDKGSSEVARTCRNMETIAGNIEDYLQSSDPDSQIKVHINVRRLKNLANNNIRGDC